MLTRITSTLLSLLLFGALAGSRGSAAEAASGTLPGKAVFVLDAAAVAPFRVKLRGSEKLESGGDLMQPWSANLWDAASTGEAAVQAEPVDGSKAVSLVNIEGKPAIQLYTWKKIDLAVDVLHAAVIEYLTKGSGSGALNILGNGATLLLPSTGGVWKTALITFTPQAGKASVQPNISNAAMGAENGLYVKRLELRQLPEQTAPTGPPIESPVKISANDPQLRYFGRWDTSKAEERTSQWVAAYVKAGFTGKRIAVELGEGSPSSFFVRVDDGAWTPFRNKQGTVEVTPAAGLGAGAHQLQIVAEAGKNLVFRGLVLEKGATPAPAKVSPKTVLFIGDSITLGTSATNPTVESWAWRTTEALGTEHIRIAQGGIALVSGYDAPLGKSGMDKQFSKLGSFGSPSASTDYKDFGNEKPDLIVVNLGTNDASKPENKVPMDVFSKSYTAFLQELRAKHPAATILALEIFNSFAREKVVAINAAVQAAGDPKIQLIKTSGWVDPNPNGGDIAPDWSHPTDQGHGKIAAKLIEALRPHLK